MFLLVVIVIACMAVYIILQVCERMPVPPGKPGNTNAPPRLGDITMTVPGYEGPGCGSNSTKSLDKSYRLVLQRKIGTNDWDDLGGVDYTGSPAQFFITTNWTDLALFRVKAYPSSK